MILSNSMKQAITNVTTSISNIIDRKISAHDNHASSTNFGHVKAGGAPQSIGTTVSAGTDNGYYARADHVHTCSYNNLTDKPSSFTPSAHSHVNEIYPVGSIYITSNEFFNPSNSFGGTWERIKGRFLIGADDTSKYPCGSTGGLEEVTLTANQSGVPAHGHGMTHTHNHNHTQWGNYRTGSGNTPGMANTSSSTVTTRSTSYDSTASSKSTTDNNTAINATEAHTNIPPYFAVNIWKRVA